LTSLTSELSFICVLGILNLPLSTIFLLDFGAVPTVWYFLFLFYCIGQDIDPPPRGCAGGRIGTRFLRPRGTSPLKGVNPAGTPGYRNGTVNKNEVQCWEIATLFARKRTHCNSSLWALCSWWMVHRRPVALAKLSVPTHHLSLYRVPWAFKFLNVLVLNITEKLLAGR